MKRFSIKTISLFLAVFFLLSCFFCVASVSALENNTVVTTDAVRLRSSAKITSDNTITTLDTKETLTLLADSSNGWAYVSRKDGTKGYCSVDYLNVPSDSDVTFEGVTTDDVYFRKGPSTSNESIKLLSKATSFVVSDNSNELWVKAKIGSTLGYIYREYTDITLKLPEKEPEPTIPVVPTEPDTPDWYNSSVLDEIIETTTTTEPSVAPIEVFIADENVSLEERQSYTLTYYTSDPSVCSSVSFKSSNTSVATVSADGTIKGISPGSASITAYIESSGEFDSVKVTVTKSTTPPPEEMLTLSKSEVSVNSGNHYHLTASISNVKWKTSDSSVATVSGGIVTAKAKGKVTITAYTETQSVTCKVEVVAATDGVSIYRNSAQITAGKSYYNGASSSSSVTWSSSDSGVAKVQNGFITAVAPGKAVITAHNSMGTKTCLVNVSKAEPVRFTYSSPNTAAVNEKVTLSAVTDTQRTAVKFEITVNGKITTVEATTKAKDGNTFIWNGSTKISSAGTYNVVAYAKTADGAWETCTSAPEDAKTNIFVRKTADKIKETKESRRATDEAINLIADFEGYSSSVYFDTIANNIPTIGYGKVIYIGDSFYNDMTKKEAYAYLVQTVNEGGFTSSVNSYLSKLGVYYNQQHFDALVSFVYNLGSNILSSDSDFKKIFTASTVSDGQTGKEAFINATNVNLRSGAGTSYSVVDVLNTGDKLTLVNTKPENNWYQVVTEKGKEGYVYADYVTKGVTNTSSEHYLSKINKKDFSNLMMQYHHAGPTCVWGLLYRRVDELDVFFYGEYTRNGSKNVNDFSFKCSLNSSTTL